MRRCTSPVVCAIGWSMLASAVQAQVSAGDVVAGFPGRHADCITGLYAGMKAYSLPAESEGQQRLFCPPPRAVVTKEQLATILRARLASFPIERKFPVALVLMDALKASFPCASTAR